MSTAILVLEDGTTFTGNGFGAEGETFGEVVFNTSMSGYQEILTDPSYAGQIITMTYPHIGNYGTNFADNESKRSWCKGFVVHENSRIVSNYRSEKSCSELLREQNILGIEGIDTRKLVRHIREKGAMRGGISSLETDPAKLLAKVLQTPNMNGADLASIVSCEKPYLWQVSSHENCPLLPPVEHTGEKLKQVAVIDFGVKHNILRGLVDVGCALKVWPATTSASEIIASNVDGVFLSNGPGDPAAVSYAIKTIQNLIDANIPIFGICLGHQLLALALGAKTYKLKFGHRGANHPVKNLLTGAVEITSQNHGFTVDNASIDVDNIEVTHLNLNDNTIEGIRHRSKPLFSVQYHPEASPGPHDSSYLFHNFIQLMEK